MAQDLDFLFSDDAAVPETISSFDRAGPLLLQHWRTGIQVNLVTPTSIGVPPKIARAVVRTALTSNRVRVASESGLVALKLFRKSRHDEGDIVALIKTSRVDLSGFSLAPEKMAAFRELAEAAATDPYPP